MRNSPIVCAIALIATLAGVAPAGVLHVPTQYTTIAQALAAAQSGDTILVAPGNYPENLTWPSVDGIRLIAIAGPAQTAIDGNQKGRVVVFGSGLTRATVLEGFTIINGFMNTSRNHGAGLYIQSSPTIRRNVITMNVGDGTSWNYGGGIHLTGNSRALIEQNVISENVLKNGSWNYGAGIYIDGGSVPDIIGNQILNNVNTAGSRGYGGGIFVDGSPAPNIIGNVIAGNTCTATLWNYGGGIRVYSSAEANIINNTIVNNSCTTGNWQYGGGIEYSGTANGLILNNIIALNKAATGGGIMIGGGVPVHDYNNVWNNTGGNYSGLSAGPNSIATDPLFAGVANYHLTATSPCLDAGSTSALPNTVLMDYDGDSRWLDGDLDGLKGNGAVPDMGADELAHVRLTLGGTPKTGTVVTFGISGLPGGAWVLLFSPWTGVYFANPYGLLLVGAPFGLLASGVSPGALPISVPNVSALIGVTVHFQGGVGLVKSGQPVGNVTNRLDLTIF